MAPLSRKSGAKKQTSTKGRTLVRWDMLTKNTDDLDIQLLLTVQQACNAAGVKIPWERVAITMGTKFTEGAIIQHLSKLRIRRENEGKDNPPSLRRSVPASTSAMTLVSASAGTPASGRKRRKTATPKHSTDPPNDGEDDGYDTDESEDPSYSTKPKRGKTTKTKNGNKRIKRKTTNEVESENDNENTLVCAGAPFLALKGDAGSDSESCGSRVESGEEGDGDAVMNDMAHENAIKQESMVISLGVDPAALQNLQETGNVIPAMATNTLDQHLPPWDQGPYHDQNYYLGHQNPHLGQYGGMTYGYPPPQPLVTFSGGPAFMPHSYDSNIDPGTVMIPTAQHAQRGEYLPGYTHFAGIAGAFHQQPVPQLAGQPMESTETPDQNVLDFMWTRSESSEADGLD
ncbi:hypothetical protein N7486_002795 [Penicillium sp. IBT 16267x]|nr:hypothetical protein N7486_002795 [Penicillium sp. IBT 16267x]